MSVSGEIEVRLCKTVDILAGVIGPRHLGKPETVAAARAFIEQALKELQYEFTLESYIASGHEVANLIVEISGTKSPEQILIVGAHYDTVPTTPGADDNASAVAVLLEVARLLKGHQYEKTVRMVFFPCEEPPHYHLGEMGSQIHARRCREQNEQIVGMLCLEMLGYYIDAAGSQRVPDKIPQWLRWLFPTRGNFLAAVANPRSLPLLLKFRRGFKQGTRFPLFSVPLPERIEDIRRSDHANFWDQKIPALMLTDTSYLRNANYHQPTDTPETLDYARMAEVTLGIHAAIQFLAGRR